MGELQRYESFTKEELEDLTDKCYKFTEMFCFSSSSLSDGFYPYQETFVKAIIRDVLGNYGNTISGLFSRQSGKSESVANTGAALMILLPKLASLKHEGTFVFPQLRKFINGFWVGIFAPTNMQSTTTYKRLRTRITDTNAKLFLDAPDFAVKDHENVEFLQNTGTYLELNNGSFCLQMSADKQSKIESKTFHCILLDESQQLDETVVNKSIMPMGAATNATSVATGTPSTTIGYFYNLIEFNKTEQIVRTRPDRTTQPQLHFEYDYKIAQKYNPHYKKYVQKERKKIGYDSDEFKMAYRLIWMLERGMAVPKELFEELTMKHLNILTEHKQTELVAGLDWGKGQDSTVLTIGKPLWERVDDQGRAPVEVIYWWEKVGDDYEQIFAELKEKMNSFSIRTLACDATGVGEPLVDRLTYEVPHITVIPVKFSSQSKDHLYKFFLMMLQEKKVWWPGHYRVRNTNYWKMFQHQMLQLQKEYKGQYLTCHAPEDIKNAHDDFPDSFALMLWCINEEAMPFVEISQDEFYQGRNWHQWKPGADEFSLRR